MSRYVSLLGDDGSILATAELQEDGTAHFADPIPSGRTIVSVQLPDGTIRELDSQPAPPH